jgi:hypothetical protein
VYLPCFNPDTATYYKPVENLLRGIYPSFGTTTPVYPALLSFFTLVANDNFYILLFNSLLTLLASTLLIVKARQLISGALFMPLACVLILFFNSGSLLLEETTIGPTSLFCSLTIFIFITIQSIIGSSLTIKNSLFLSFLIFVALQARPQGAFLLFFILACGVVFLLKKQYHPLLFLFAFNLMLFSGISLYNKATGSGFSALPSKLYLFTKIGNNIHNLKKPPGLPQEIAVVVDSVNASFSNDHDDIIKNSWNYNRLNSQFTISNFDKTWAFYSLIQTNEPGMKMLAQSSSGNYALRAKHSYFVFLKYFDIYTEKHFFFNDYFTNRSSVFCTTKELTMFSSPAFSALCLKDFSMFTDTSVYQAKKDSYCVDLNDKRAALFKNPLFKFSSFIDTVSYYLLNNIVWPILFFLSLFFFVYFFFNSGKSRRIALLPAIISPLLIFGNIAVFMASIVPNSRYTLATAVFLYLFVFELISLYLKLREQKS